MIVTIVFLYKCFYHRYPTFITFISNAETKKVCVSRFCPKTCDSERDSMNNKNSHYCGPCYRKRRMKQRDKNGLDTECSVASERSGEISKFGCLTCNVFICSEYWKIYEH